MSDTTQIDLDYVANLARLELTAEEKEKFSSQLGDVLKHFDKLNAVDVEGVEASAHAFPIYNVLQEDKATKPFTVEEALSNAPAQRAGQVVVPKIIEEA